MVVVLSKDWASYSQEELTLLRKILTSVKVDIDTVPVIVRRSIDLNALQIYRSPKVLMFGADSANGDLPLYQATTAQGFTVIRADDLSALDDQRKKNLWLALRQMFGM